MANVKDKYPEFYTVDDAINFDEATCKMIQEKYSNTLKVQLSGAHYFVKAENAHLTEANGKQWIDMLGAVGVMSVGNNNEFVWKQIEKVFNARCYNMGAVSYHNIAAAFYSNIARTTPGGALTKVQMATGGAEALEGCIKLVKIAHRNNKNKTKILSTINAFHGKTAGAVSVGGKDTWQAYQGGLILDQVTHIPYNDVAALKKELETGQYQAFFMEPVQGEGGVNVASEEFFKTARDLCTKTNTYLVADEVQTGCGRTGKMWACQWFDIIPDVMSFAKGISGGFIPLAGYCAKPEVHDAAYGTPETAFHHTATYQGCAYAAASGIAALQFIIENDLPGMANEKGKVIFDAMKATKEKYPGIIKDVRGKGMIIGVEFEPTKPGLEDKYGANWATECERFFSEEFRIQVMHSFNNQKVFRWLPPLTAPMEDIEYAIKSFDAAVKHVYDLAK
ncbi:MAG: aminotransferase class III-fold pyridoxal phosphate-dependent enzyme [Planctomycetota bacterium]|jgi:putrescine aminotransferase|nr:aminotransferase class III-fold pyridoxal phosphate-dependent enzyme [Planctomycetota bacterium]